MCERTCKHAVNSVVVLKNIDFISETGGEGVTFVVIYPDSPFPLQQLKSSVIKRHRPKCKSLIVASPAGPRDTHATSESSAR